MFKTEKEHNDWNSGELDPRLFGIVMAQVRLVEMMYSPYIIEVTSIYRPDDEASVHAYWRGVDWVIRGLTGDSHNLIVDYTNKWFPYQKEGYKTAKYHNVGFGLHVHNQVCAIEEV
jgi:hypothetical protein